VGPRSASPAGYPSAFSSASPKRKGGQANATNCNQRSHVSHGWAASPRTAQEAALAYGREARQQGAAKQTEIGDPRGGSEAKKGPGPDFLEIFFVVFLNSPHGETPKNAIPKKSRKNGFESFVDFFVKTFRHDFFAKRFL
jgi:hypothetical protein